MRRKSSRGYNLNMKLTTEEIMAYRKGQHKAESKSLSAFVRECVQIRLIALELEDLERRDAILVPANFGESGESA